MQVDGATAEHGGTYLCSVTNILQERWTEAVDVNVGELQKKVSFLNVCPTYIKKKTTLSFSSNCGFQLFFFYWVGGTFQMFTVKRKL